MLNPFEGTDVEVEDPNAKFVLKTKSLGLDPMLVEPQESSDYGTFTTGLPTVDEGLTPLVNNNGDIVLHRQESGQMVPVRNIGSVKDFFKSALRNAALMRLNDSVDLSQLSHIEIAAIALAKAAAGGDVSAINTMFDRELGRATQVTDNRNLNMSLDEILNAMPSNRPGRDSETTFDAEVINDD